MKTKKSRYTMYRAFFYAQIRKNNEAGIYSMNCPPLIDIVSPVMNEA